MVKEVIWSRVAHENRIDILEYWNQRNKSTAFSKRLNRIFESNIELIRKYPGIGKQTEIEGIRFKIVKNYLITYRETRIFIEILTIWDSRQDPDKFQGIIEKFNR